MAPIAENGAASITILAHETPRQFGGVSDPNWTSPSTLLFGHTYHPKTLSRK